MSRVLVQRLLGPVMLLLLASAAAPAFAWEAVDGNADMQVIVDCLNGTGENNIYLRHLGRSGFQRILGNYLGLQPITLLVPTDDAFRALPGRIVGRLNGVQRIKMIEFHMLKQLFPAEYIRGVLDTAFFETVLSNPTDGPFIYKQPPVDPETVVLASKQDPSPDEIATIVEPDACGLPTRTIGVQIIDSVLIPPGLFDSETR